MLDHKQEKEMNKLEVLKFILFNQNSWCITFWQVVRYQIHKKHEYSLILSFLVEFVLSNWVWLNGNILS